MLKIAIKAKPNFVCIVPEKRKELTTEGGLNIQKNNRLLKKIIYTLNNHDIRTSLFIEPSIRDIKKSKKLGADCVEIHTGKFCSSKNKKILNYEFSKLKKASTYAFKKPSNLITFPFASKTYSLSEICNVVFSSFADFI